MARATIPSGEAETMAPISQLGRLRRVVGRYRKRKARPGETQTATIPSNETQVRMGTAPRGSRYRRGAQTEQQAQLQSTGTQAATEALAAGQSSAGTQPVPTNGEKPSVTAKLQEGATGVDTGVPPGGVAGTPGKPGATAPSQAYRPAGTTPEGQQVYRNERGQMVYRDAEGQLRPYSGTAISPTQPVGEFMGDVDPETGEATAPEIGEYGEQELGKLEELATAEMGAAEESLQEAETDVAGRETETETLLAEGRERLDATVRATDDIAEVAKGDAAQLPGQVEDALQGIADRYKETTDIDVDRIEGLGREAVGMAMEGKNAAAQAAVSAQQQAMRDAEARINADPNIPAGRKAAILSQLRVNGSMQIATTIGANIKDFTKMQVGAMTDTMTAVGQALSQRSAGLATMGAAEIGAVAGAYDTAAKISSGFDELRIQTRNNTDSIRFNYDNLTANYRDAKDGTSLALLDAENYVNQLPYDFALNSYAIGRDILGTDFATKLQAGNYNNLQEALAAGEEWARTAMMSQLLMQLIPGPFGAILGGGTMLLGGGLR